MPEMAQEDRGRASGEAVAKATLALERMRTAAKTVQMVMRVTTAVNRAADLERLVATVLDQTLTTLEARTAQLYLVAAERGELQLAGQRNLPDDLLPRLTRLPLGAPDLAAYAAATRQIQAVEDSAALDPTLTLTREVLSSTGSGSKLAAPLVAFGQLVGVLTYTLAAPHHFEPEERAALGAAAEIVAVGLTKALAYEQERRLRGQIEAVSDAALAISEEFELREVLQEIVDQARAVAGAQYAALGVGTNPGQPFAPWVFSGLTLDQGAAIGRVPPHPVGLLGAVPHGQQTLRLRNVAQDARFLGVPPGHPEITSYLGAPLRFRGRSTGNLYLANKLGGGEFTAADQQAIELLAQHAALAVEHARIHDQMAAEIAERQQSQEALRQSEERYRLLAEHAQDVIFRYRLLPTPGFEYVNPAVTRVLGYTPEEHYADPGLIYKMVHPDDRALLDAVIQSPASFTMPLYLRWIRKDGAVIWGEEQKTPVFDGAGNLIAIEGVLRDVTERKRAEEEREQLLAREQAAAEQLAAMLRAATDYAIVATNLSGIVTVFNHGAELMLGYRAGEVVGQITPPLWHDPADIAARAAELGVPADNEAFVAPARQGETQTSEWTFIRKDGSRFTGLLTIAPLLDRHGELMGFLGMALDISARKEAEARTQRLLIGEQAARAAAEMAERRYRDLVDSLDAVVWEADPVTFAFTFISRRAEQLLGYPAEQWLGNPDFWVSVLHPEDRERAVAYCQGAVAAGLDHSFEYRMVAADGRVIWINDLTRVIKGSDGRPQQLRGLMVDITERKRVEAEREQLLVQLETERTWLRTVIEHSPTGILLIEGAAAERVVANRRAEEIFGRGRPSERGVAQHVRYLSHPDGRPFAPAEMPSLRALRGEVVIGTEQVFLRGDGRKVPLWVNAAPVRDGAGAIGGAVVIFEDATVAKELEQLREEWISIIAHDLRQPVTVITGYAQMLERRAQRKMPAQREMIEQILDSVRLLNRMIGDLLDASRIEARRLTLEPDEVDLLALVEAVAGRVAGLTNGSPVRVVGKGAIPRLEADPGRLEQVLGNLLSNAAKYGYPDAEILVEVECMEGDVQVSVTNRGDGIAPEELPQLFSRFRRTRRAREQRIGGIGLGLYITQGLIEAHGGRIWAESIPGQTTAFRFTLPLRQGPR